MRTDPTSSHRMPWRRLAWQGLVAAAGLATIVGSGGGLSLGFPPCGPPLCNVGPITPMPTVHLAPADVTATVGAPATFVTMVTNVNAPSYQWRRSDDGGTTWANLPGATGSQLTLPAVNLGDHGAWVQVAVSSGGVLQAQAIGQLHVSATPGIAYADGEFLPADWVFSPVLGTAPAPAASSAEQMPTGGHPGAWWRMQVQLATGTGSARVSFMSTSAEYDPRQHGAIAAIAHTEDCNALQPSDTAYTDAWLALEQAGRHYVAVETVNLGNCARAGWWPVVGRGRLVEQDFTLMAGPACAAGEACPDFSATAQPLRFGFTRHTWATPGQTVPHGIDNWKVTVWRR